MTEKTLKELAAEANDAEARLRGMGAEARRLVRAARAEQRSIQDRWDLPAELKSQGQKAVRETARSAVRTLQTERAIYRGRIERYVAAASLVRTEGDTASELRRSRAYSSIESTLAAEPNLASREMKFRSFITEAADRADLLTLEALRELAPHLAASGVDVDSATIAELDRLAGPPVARLAREMEARAMPGTDWLSNTIGTAERALDEPFAEPLGLLTADYDRTLVPLDDWQPEVSV